MQLLEDFLVSRLYTGRDTHRLVDIPQHEEEGCHDYRKDLEDSHGEVEERMEVGSVCRTAGNRRSVKVAADLGLEISHGILEVNNLLEGVHGNRRNVRAEASADDTGGCCLDAPLEPKGTTVSVWGQRRL
jgi:hypothetical protein